MQSSAEGPRVHCLSSLTSCLPLRSAALQSPKLLRTWLVPTTPARHCKPLSHAAPSSCPTLRLNFRAGLSMHKGSPALQRCPVLRFLAAAPHQL